ncbi:MAG: octanoyltransferase [Gammaproteobacteria bacterium]|jgi:lipoyl(octanoyl) transferase|nr:octanoyltransferase [Gammaproteobacteria bacterium]|tara:strand:- start:3005 stop:3613 length:609 start_codon:yes stop_codon:yes gene_type:complete
MRLLTFRNIGFRPLPDVWEEMKKFTDERNRKTQDEVWLVEHPPIYTLGLNSNPDHVLEASNIPILKIDRGGQVTYHGPGQLIAYVMLDLHRSRSSIRSIVEALEAAVIRTVSVYGIEAQGRRDAPGVYVGDKKLAAIGLRVRRHCTYHGLAVNVNMDLTPYERINPCGFEGLEVVQLSDLCHGIDISRVRKDLEMMLRASLS